MQARRPALSPNRLMSDDGNSNGLHAAGVGLDGDPDGGGHPHYCVFSWAQPWIPGVWRVQVRLDCDDRDRISVSGMWSCVRNRGHPASQGSAHTPAAVDWRGIVRDASDLRRCRHSGHEAESCARPASDCGGTPGGGCKPGRRGCSTAARQRDHRSIECGDDRARAAVIADNHRCARPVEPNRRRSSPSP